MCRFASIHEPIKTPDGSAINNYFEWHSINNSRESDSSCPPTFPVLTSSQQHRSLRSVRRTVFRSYIIYLSLVKRCRRGQKTWSSHGTETHRIQPTTLCQLPGLRKRVLGQIHSGRTDPRTAFIPQILMIPSTSYRYEYSQSLCAVFRLLAVLSSLHLFSRVWILIQKIDGWTAIWRD